MKHHWPSLSKLPLPPVDSGLVQILIGMDVVGAHRRLNMQSTDTSISAELHFQTTCLLSNKCPDEPAVGACSVDQSLVATVESLWSTESFGTNLDAKTIMYKEDAQALHTLESTVKDIGNRYEVGLLWKDQDCILPNNKSTALKYFRQQRADLRQTRSWQNNTKSFKNTFRAEVEKPERKVWYLCYHGVGNANKPKFSFDRNSILYPSLLVNN